MMDNLNNFIDSTPATILVADDSLTVLVADDSLTVRMELAELLEDGGYLPVLVEDGQKALDAIMLFTPDLVILDVVMPGLDGIEVCTRIKENPETVHIPVVIITSKNDVDDKIRGLEAGADDYLFKPFDHRVFAAKINAIFRNKERANALNKKRLLETQRNILATSNVQLQQLNEQLQQTQAQLELRHQELINARQIVEKVTRAKADFLANMSHEIRTPLNGIIVGSGLLGTTPMSSEQDHYLSGIARSGHQMMHLVNNILDFSTLEVGQMVLSQRPYDVHLLLEEMTTFYRLEADKRDNRLTLTIDPSVPKVLCGDQHRMKQIFSNLISNAVHHTFSGSIDIELTCLGDATEKANTSQTAEPDCARYQFRVTDTGSGIEAQILPRLFDQYRQGRQQCQQATRGTGLGLAIARQLAELMAGGIRVATTPEQGSTFTVEFEQQVHPQQDEVISLQRLEAESTWYQSELNIGMAEYLPLRILVAEDNSINRGLLVMLLDKLGYQATAVSNGFEVLNAISENPYDVILMDINMPKMNGLEATRQIVQMYPRDKRPRIIALSASSLKEDVEACFEAGVEDYLCKPLQLDDIQVALKKGHDLSQCQIPLAKFNDKAKQGARQGIVNRETLGQYHDDAVAKISALFISQMSEIFEQLPGLVAEQNADKIFEYCYASKGACLNLGAELMASKLERLLVLVQNQDFARIGAKLADLADCFEMTRLELADTNQ